MNVKCYWNLILTNTVQSTNSNPLLQAVLILTKPYGALVKSIALHREQDAIWDATLKLHDLENSKAEGYGRSLGPKSLNRDCITRKKCAVFFQIEIYVYTTWKDK